MLLSALILLALPTLLGGFALVLLNRLLSARHRDVTVIVTVLSWFRFEVSVSNTGTAPRPDGISTG